MSPGPQTRKLWRQNEETLARAVKSGAVAADDANGVYNARPDREEE